MRKIPLVAVSLVIVFGLIIFLKDASEDVFEVPVSDGIRRDMQLPPGEAGSLRGLSASGQKTKATKSEVADQKKRPTQLSEGWQKPIDPLLFSLKRDGAPPGVDMRHMAQIKRDGASPSIDMFKLALAQQRLSPYLRAFRLRAIQAGIPPQQAARLSAQVAALAWSAQLAGANPAEAAGIARSFGEQALSSSVHQ